MGVLAFDTHKAVKVLRDAGADEHLAEAVVDTISSAMGENVATKADITELKADITELKTDITELKTDIDNLKTDIDELKVSTKADITKLKTDIDELKVATKADIAELKTDIDKLKISTKADIAELKVWMLGHLWVAVGVIIGALSLLAYLFLPARPG